MNDGSGSEGHGQGEHREAEVLFPAQGDFSPVVPLSQSGREAARAGEPPASAGPDEPEETTLVPARTSPGRRPAHTPRAKQEVEQSWAFLAAAVVLSLAAGAAAGVYMLRWQRPAETYRTGPPAAEGVAAGKVEGTEPAAGPSTPQPSGPGPQSDRDRLAAGAGSSVQPAETAAAVEADTKAERVHTSAPLQKASPQAAEPPARRAAEPEPRAARPAREAAEALPAPRLTRANVGSPHTERNAPATVTRPELPALVSSPPPSAKPKKVIQWP